MPGPVVCCRNGPTTPKSDFKIRQNWPSEFFIFINHASNWKKKRHFPAFPRPILLRDVKINIFSVFEWERKEDPYFTGYTITIQKFRTHTPQTKIFRGIRWCNSFFDWTTFFWCKIRFYQGPLTISDFMRYPQINRFLRLKNVV